MFTFRVSRQISGLHPTIYDRATKELALMEVTLEAIKFNHDPTFETTGAFNIRRNEQDLIGFPEWRRGESEAPEDSPVAYRSDKVKNLSFIVIKAKFSTDNRSLTKITVKALETTTSTTGNAPNILGESGSTEVTLTNGESQFEQFTLITARISQVAVGITNIAWQWVYSLNSDPDNWIDLAVTQHRIYTVVSMPQLPWAPASSVVSDTQIPWTDVLEQACSWAASAKDTDDAATRVTKKLKSLGDDALVKYDDPNSGATDFTLDSPFAFDCTAFLNLLTTGGSRRGQAVNCDDCAAIVVSFANILGCTLNEGSMGIPAFFPKCHLRIGVPTIQTGRFYHHTVAWKDRCAENNRLFDGCLQLDRNDSSCSNPDWFVPTDILFGQLGQQEYRFHLALQPDLCLPSRDPRRRRIGIPIIHPADDSFRIVSQLAKNNSFISGHVLKALPLGNWRPEHHNFVETTVASYLNESFWTHTGDEGGSIAVDAYECETRQSALALTASVLATFQLTKIEEGRTDFGEVAFATPDNYAIVFLRDRFVFRIRNTGAHPVSCDDFGRLVDQLLKTKNKIRR